ncbi:WecB/TagA/CpsF family glycosyltransferase [Candidatus Shapirobacteria bacterium]|nr:WecB/TagA/CpsF family glycosyltransferase [Candidatus Shapirobacteria bacterium]
MRLKLSNLSLIETVDWVRSHDNGLVFCCTTNELMMAKEDSEFAKKLSSADLLTTDGMPLVWLNRLRTGKGSRVYGPELMEKFTNSKDLNPSRASRDLPLTREIKHLFVGDEKNRKFFLKHGDYVVMPMKDEFETKDYDELAEIVKKSKAEIVWLGLGAKKQVETGYELKKRKVKKMIVTVGAAFDFLSGNKKQCPRWLRDRGGEWLYRLMTEPKRLAGRYWKNLWFLLRGNWD